jgi:hypothetical protein
VGVGGARGTERQQLRWVALAAWLSVLALVVVLAGLVLGSDAIVNWAAGVLVAILPLGTAAAILRYRLYDLDRIISRTVAYGLLTVLLAGGYAAVVLGSASSWAATPAWSSPPPPWPWPPPSSRPAAASSRGLTGASTGIATTRPRPSRPSAPACATRSTWPP